jgi:hypothetical protein
MRFCIIHLGSAPGAAFLSSIAGREDARHRAPALMRMIGIQDTFAESGDWADLMAGVPVATADR